MRSTISTPAGAATTLCELVPLFEAEAAVPLGPAHICISTRDQQIRLKEQSHENEAASESWWHLQLVNAAESAAAASAAARSGFAVCFLVMVRVPLRVAAGGTAFNDKQNKKSLPSEDKPHPGPFTPNHPLQSTVPQTDLF